MIGQIFGGNMIYDFFLFDQDGDNMVSCTVVIHFSRFNLSGDLAIFASKNDITLIVIGIPLIIGVRIIEKCNTRKSRALKSHC